MNIKDELAKMALWTKPGLFTDSPPRPTKEAVLAAALLEILNRLDQTPPPSTRTEK